MEEIAKSAAIEITDFLFRYPNSVLGIGPINWHVEEGAFQLLVGATGSGKTTLLRCCKPAIAPEGVKSGSIALFGQMLETLDARQAATCVGYVSQNPDNQIVCDTVWHEIAFGLENLGIPRDQMRRRVAEVACFFGIEELFHCQISELSGGQRHLVSLASVLVMQPRVLLLDEPTAQLDPVAEKNFLHALFRINRELGITVVVATHAPELMTAYATEVVRLQDGQICKASLGQFKQCFLSAKTTASQGRQASSCKPVVSLRDAFVRYTQDSEWVLRGCNLEVFAGHIHAIVGGNGSGKSTLLRLIAGALNSERGRVVNSLKVSQALLTQDPKALFVCDTVQEELLEWQQSCGYSDTSVQDMLERFKLVEHLGHHPYDLSGGQQQKLAFAKLLLTNPDFLLLDEPTKGLDASSKMLMAHVFAGEAKKGKTILFATHDLAFAALVADLITMIFDGEAVCTENPEEFFAENMFYRPVEDGFTQMWQKQD